MHRRTTVIPAPGLRRASANHPSRRLLRSKDRRRAEFCFARLLYRGEPRDDLVREYYEVYHLHDEAPARRIALPSGRLVRSCELYTEAELKTSVAYNERWRRMRGQKGLTVHFDQPDGLRIFWGVADPAAGDGWESTQVALVERLAPHVRQFVSMRQALAAADSLRESRRCELRRLRRPSATAKGELLAIGVESASSRR